MSLVTTINTAIKAAMLAKEATRLQALRAIKSALLLEQTKGSEVEITEADEIKLLQKLVKQRKDSAVLYASQGREDLAQPELDEAQIIASFLPEQLSEQEVEQVVKEIVAQTAASSMADMGKVMGIASQKLAGKTDGKTIAAIVKKVLS